MIFYGYDIQVISWSAWNSRCVNLWCLGFANAIFVSYFQGSSFFWVICAILYTIAQEVLTMGAHLHRPPSTVEAWMQVKPFFAINSSSWKQRTRELNKEIMYWNICNVSKRTLLTHKKYGNMRPHQSDTSIETSKGFLIFFNDKINQ